MSKLKKLKFSINNNEFTLPLSSYREQTWGGSLEKYIHMSAKNSATVIKQFVKQKFPQLKVWAVSDTYSGGSSTRVYVCNPDGSEVDYDIFKQISQWKHILQGGNFNGMEDMEDAVKVSVRVVSRGSRPFHVVLHPCHVPTANKE